MLLDQSSTLLDAVGSRILGNTGTSQKESHELEDEHARLSGTAHCASLHTPKKKRKRHTTLAATYLKQSSLFLKRKTCKKSSIKSPPETTKCECTSAPRFTPQHLVHRGRIHSCVAIFNIVFVFFFHFFLFRFFFLFFIFFSFFVFFFFFEKSKNPFRGKIEDMKKRLRKRKKKQHLQKKNQKNEK